MQLHRADDRRPAVPFHSTFDTSLITYPGPTSCVLVAPLASCLLDGRSIKIRIDCLYYPVLGTTGIRALLCLGVLGPRLTLQLVDCHANHISSVNGVRLPLHAEEL